jgi:hypothetical protein
VHCHQRHKEHRRGCCGAVARTRREGLKRIGQPDDVAFLASQGRWITGDTIRIDGGSKLITKQSLVKKIEAAYDKAMESGQISAAVAAAKEIAVLLGIRIERSERGGAGEFDWMDKLSDEELRRFAAGELDLADLRRDGADRREWPVN